MYAVNIDVEVVNTRERNLVLHLHTCIKKREVSKRMRWTFHPLDRKSTLTSSHYGSKKCRPVSVRRSRTIRKKHPAASSPVKPSQHTQRVGTSSRPLPPHSAWLAWAGSLLFFFQMCWLVGRWVNGMRWGSLWIAVCGTVGRVGGEARWEWGDGGGENGVYILVPCTLSSKVRFFIHSIYSIQ